MAGPLLNSCCRCQPLRTGSIISGVGAILLAIVALVILFVSRVEFKTIVFDWLPSWIVKIILAVNLCMTILISIIMILGVLKVSISFWSIIVWINLIAFYVFTAKPLLNVTMGNSWIYADHIAGNFNYIHNGGVLHWWLYTGRCTMDYCRDNLCL